MELKEYFGIIKKRLWIIVLCVVIATLTTALYSKLYFQPIYQASTKIIVNKTIDVEQLGREQMDLAAMGVNIRLIETYKEIIKTPAITEKVVQRYPELNLSPELLSQIINVQSVNNTQVMTITAQYFTYERAMQIVNAVTSVFQTEIPKIMKVNNVAILHTANMEDHPVATNQRSSLYVIISAAVSLLFAVGLSFLLEYLNDTLRSEADVQQALGLPTLAIVAKLDKKDLKLPKQSSMRKQGGEVTYAAIES